IRSQAAGVMVTSTDRHFHDLWVPQGGRTNCSEERIAPASASMRQPAEPFTKTINEAGPDVASIEWGSRNEAAQTRGREGCAGARKGGRTSLAQRLHYVLR